MNILYLIFHGLESYNGVSKKICYQVEALKELGVNVKLCYIDIDDNGRQKRMIDDFVLESFKDGIVGKLKKWTDYSAILNYIDENKIDCVYMRSYHNADPFLISALKRLKKKGVKVVMEIPTYPYDNEYRNTSLVMRLYLLRDKCFRYAMAKQLFRIVTFSDYQQIFNVPTINISNGIDFNSVKIKSGQGDIEGKINLIGVAEIHRWHGFDRLIKGLAIYYSEKQNRDIKFNIVGYGDKAELSKLEQLVTDNNLEGKVVFHGPRYGEELNQLFDQADMGIASLARHRSNITNIKTLKNREYAARGIPFIYSETDSDFDTMPYVKKIPANEEPINVKSLIHFLDSVSYLKQDDIRNSIQHLSWKNQMAMVLESIT